MGNLNLPLIIQKNSQNIETFGYLDNEDDSIEQQFSIIHDKY